VEVDLPFITSRGSQSLHLQTSINRSTFESLIDPFVARSIEVCERALRDSFIKPAEIDNVVLVGGSTRIPLIQKHLKLLFGTSRLPLAPAPGVKPKFAPKGDVVTLEVLDLHRDPCSTTIHARQ
jgi:molecular chaperone DnaK (HSP70)